MSVEGL